VSALPATGQTGGQLHAFVAGAGTGGTIAGVSRYLKARNARIQARAAPAMRRLRRRGGCGAVSMLLLPASGRVPPGHAPHRAA